MATGQERMTLALDCAMLREGACVCGPVAEKLKLSMPKPWPPLPALVICHVNHNAAPGGQLLMARLVTPSAAVRMGPDVPAVEEPTGKLTFRLVRAAVILLTENLLVPVGSM